jgi:outer membrane lipoprotein-sorting protein
MICKSSNHTVLSIFLQIFLTALIPALLTGSALSAGRELTAEEILNKVDDLYRGESCSGTMVMKIATENWSRELKMQFWSLGKDYSLYKILSPEKEKDTATLKSSNDIWNYLPKVNRIIKLPSSMMSQSWMGSHITNDDLVKDSRFADDYTFDVTFQGEKEGKQIIEITCIPKEDAPVVWGEVLVWVEDKTYLPLKLFYYDEDLKLARTMIFSDVKKLDDRDLPAVVKVIPADKPNESTVVIYDNVKFNVEINKSFFSIRNLQK